MTNNSDVPNPLLERLPVFNDIQEVAYQLRYLPLKNTNVKTLSVMKRIELLVCEAAPFEPTVQAVRIACTLVGMLYGSYESRNPVVIKNRQDLLVLLAAGARGLEKIPKISHGQVSAQVIQGVTGVGKTVLLKRLCSLIPQAIVRGPNKETGWQQCVQITYLHVPMSHDGSRGGLLHGIFSEIDSLLGTRHAIDVPKKYTGIEKQVVQVCALLHTHYVGLLIIDELQSRNIVTSVQSDKMQLFLLSIMNSGIPLVLVGNPLGFTWIDDFSQDLRRLYNLPPEVIHPVGAINEVGEKDWNAIFKGVSSYYVLNDPVKNISHLKKKLLKLSGGIPDLAFSIWRAAQRNVLQSGKNLMSSDDLQAAYDSRGFDKLRPLAEGFYNKDPIILSRYEDSNWHYYADTWGIKINQDDIQPNKPLLINAVGTKKKRTPKKRVSEQSKLKAKITREKNKDAARKKLTQELSEDDIRSAGIQQYLLDSLEGLSKI